MTGVAGARLEHPPVVPPDASLTEARGVMDGAGSRWAVVVDGDGRLDGWLGRERADGDGAVADRCRPVAARVEAGSSLEDALAQLLLDDTGWVAVVEGDRYLGVLTPGALHAASRRPLPPR